MFQRGCQQVLCAALPVKDQAELPGFKVRRDLSSTIQTCWDTSKLPQEIGFGATSELGVRGNGSEIAGHFLQQPGKRAVNAPLADGHFQSLLPAALQGNPGL